ncbi:serine/threonine protein kinase [Piscinibacter sakaiensis]
MRARWPGSGACSAACTASAPASASCSGRGSTWTRWARPRARWQATVDRLLEHARRAFDAAGARTDLRLHGDCHIGNILWTAAGPHFVDLDDCASGPAVQDLWMLLSGDPGSLRAEARRLLEGYEQFMDFDDAELALVEPLRSLRMIHHSAWIARRWSDPAFPAAFPWFGQGNYWAQKLSELQEQLDRAEG